MSSFGAVDRSSSNMAGVTLMNNQVVKHEELG